MKRLFAGAAVAAGLTIAAPAGAVTPEQNERMEGLCLPVWTGTDRTQPHLAYCEGYLIGFQNALASAHKICSNHGDGPPSTLQLNLIAAKWTVEHPEDMNRPVAMQLRNALTAAFPCP